MRRYNGFSTFKTLIYITVLVGVCLAIFIASPLRALDHQVQATPAEDRQIANLKDLNQALIDIVANVKPTVVTVSTERTYSFQENPFITNPLFDFFFGPQQGDQGQAPKEYHQRGLGSGVIINSDGHILTNNHVIDGADSIFVRLYDGRRLVARVVGVDPKTDIAVLQIKADKLPYIGIGNSDSLQVGELVLAIGSPMSENLAYTVTQGIVSAKGRSDVGLAYYEDFIQTDAAINPGNSGGPLINLNGEMVGINTAIASQNGGFMGIGFSVPSNMVKNVMNSLLKKGRVIRGWLGVNIQNLNEAIARALKLDRSTGALVADVITDSPADKAGIKSGDVILSADSKEVKSAAQLSNYISSRAPGSEVTLKILRDGKRLDIRARLGEMTPEIAAAPGSSNIEKTLGFSVTTFDRQMADRYGIDEELSGVIVTAMDPDSPAGYAGLRQGDLIQEVDREKVQTEQQFDKLIAKKDKGDTLLLRIYRSGGSFFIAFVLP